MKVKLSQAVKMFFGNSSLEMVYFEAIANALDAKATEINIKISAKARNEPKSMELTISDNGVGIDELRYRKFSNLFDVQESSHKGLGRLVYLCYFNKVSITSFFDKTKKREFEFTDSFEEASATVTEVKEGSTGTTFYMTGYSLQKFGKYDYITPSYLVDRILEEFYPRFFKLKEEGIGVTINIESIIEGIANKETLVNKDIPFLEKVELDSSINLFNSFHLHYSIQQYTDYDINKQSLIAAIAVDNRTMKVEIVSTENIPYGYKIVFLLFSDYFTGKVDLSRQNLMISKSELQSIQLLFRKKAAQILEENIPDIIERNKKTKNLLVQRYPHLSGYFDSESIGYISRSDVLKKAQEQFFKAQKDLLEAHELTDEQYKQSLEISARALTEYILFRQMTINRLKTTTREDHEAELHKLLVPMNAQLSKDELVKDLYRNNMWILDDKYMTYEKVLSDVQMDTLVTTITEEETEKDLDRPDIALVFSANPNNGTAPFDVVIVELKKRGISLEKNMVVVTQLEKRARKLMHYYNNRIQRIWYYGIIEFNEEVELQLSGEYQELYSSGKMFYRETQVAIQLDPSIKLPVGIFIWDIDAMITDADSRNSAFLNLIKSQFIKE
ncbi:MAG: ATP-binding protein [Aureispira sp.]